MKKLLTHKYLGRLLILGSILFTGVFQGTAQTVPTGSGLTIEDFTASEYGDGTSIGFGILNGISLITRTRVGQGQDQLGGSIGFSTAPDDPFNPQDLFIVTSILPEYNFYLGNTYKEKIKRTKVKQKYRKHFLSAKPGILIGGEGLRYVGAITWHRQTYTPYKTDYTRGFDLGLQYISANDTFDDMFTLFLRVDWSWFRNGQ